MPCGYFCLANKVTRQARTGQEACEEPLCASALTITVYWTRQDSFKSAVSLIWSMLIKEACLGTRHMTRCEIGMTSSCFWNLSSTIIVQVIHIMYGVHRYGWEWMGASGENGEKGEKGENG